VLTKASSEKREKRPHSKSLMRGYVTPQCFAAATPTQLLSSTTAVILSINCERRRRFAASSGVSAIVSYTLW
jgi:hypothetical protein